MKVFERALVRAGAQMVYSQGFNPRPKLSLPLPRSVGVEADEDLLCLYIDSSSGSFDCESFGRKLAEQLPEGIELISATELSARSSAVPIEAAYFFPLNRDILCDEQKLQELRSNIEDLLSSSSIVVQRKLFKGRLKVKELDVRGFLKDIELAEDGVLVRCNVSNEGGIRIDELMGILKLNMYDIDLPIRRTEVKWRY
jgi:radical SAM-linked protein